MMDKEGINELFEDHDESTPIENKLDPVFENKIVANHSGYNYKGSENFEHDDNSGLHNYSGVEDEVYSSLADHEDWEDGYDY